jgi:hypothetical protein
LQLQGKRCAEFGELDSLRRNEIETIKAFVTRQVDNVRPHLTAASRLKSTGSRFSLGRPTAIPTFGTIPVTGALTRVEVGYLDFAALERDRDQLWAEALFIYRNSLEDVLYLDNGAEAHAVEIQKGKVVLDDSAFMVESLINWIKLEQEKPEKERFDLSRFKLVTLFEGMGPLAKFQETGRNIQFASKALKLIGGLNIKSNGNMYWKIEKPVKTPPLPHRAPRQKIE